MDENKDKQIQRLFDDYAESLEVNSRLADKARDRLRQSNERKSKAKRPWWLAVAAGCVAFVALVLSIPFMRSADGSGGNMRPVPDTPKTKSYSISEVKATRADADFAKDYITTSLNSGAEVFSENYYACYIKATGEFVYLKAVLGISYNGGILQLCIVAEKSGYEGEELTNDYKDVISDIGYKYNTEYICGEYVTTAYRKKSDYKYYVTAYGNVEGGHSIVAEIIGEQNF